MRSIGPDSEAEGITSDTIIAKLIQLIPRAEADVLDDRKLPHVAG